jgi:hypothetical protein
MTDYATYQPSLHPTALAGPYGLSWGRSQGTMKDRVITLATDALDAGLVLRCPDDALPLLGADVALEQLPSETSTSYRARILGAWDTWPWAGTRTGLTNVAAQLLYQGATLITAAEWGVSLASTLWARWWLLIDFDAKGFAAEDAWGTGTWGDGGTWGSDAPLAEVARCRRALRQFTNARDVGHLRFAFGDTDYWGEPDGLFANGDWGSDPAFLEWRV